MEGELYPSHALYSEWLSPKDLHLDLRYNRHADICNREELVMTRLTKITVASSISKCSVVLLASQSHRGLILYRLSASDALGLVWMLSPVTLLNMRWEQTPQGS
jgi:hypothetical protein